MSAPIELSKIFLFLENYFDGDNALIACLSYFLCVCGISAFLALMFIDSPYGKHASPSFGFPVPAKLAWIVQEIPNVIIWLLLVYSNRSTIAVNSPSLVLLGFFIFHYVQRTFIFPLLIRGGKPSPFLVFFLALLFCSINSFIQCQSLLLNPMPKSSYQQPHFVAGCVVFVGGILINLHSDHILRNLRKPGETGYKVPIGGMFNLVSGANMFGEFVEWTGFALASWSLPGFTFAFFTFCNLAPRALSHHRWYKSKFDDYPKNRKAFIPFLL